MNQNEAARLADTIAATWSTGAKRFVWFDVLQQDRYAVSESWAVYRALRDDDQRPPTVARFRELYRLQTRDAVDDRPDPLPPLERCWSPMMYAEHVRQRAEAGDAGAAAELARLDRVIGRAPLLRRLDDELADNAPPF